MIDIRLLRDEKTREALKRSEINRFKDSNVIDELYELDKKKIKLQFNIEKLNKEINKNNHQISAALKAAKLAETKNKTEKDQIVDSSINDELKEEKMRLKKEVVEIEERIKILISEVGNVLDEEVPISKTEDGNVTLRTYLDEGCIIYKKGFHEIMAPYTNLKIGSKVVGHRGYYLEGKMAQLAMALKIYAINFLIKRSYKHIQTPVMLLKDVMGKTAQLSDFDEQLYRVGDSHFLIATSEQPLTAIHMDSQLLDKDLPILYAGESLCFRKEAGAYGKDNAGIFRIHQFEKIEQFIICKPEDSKDWHEKIIKTAEEFYQSLKIPYRVVAIASGELNNAASKKYDLEAWFPYQQKYRELVSASNCTDYQSRNLNVYYGYTKKDTDKPAFTHMLNGTLCAVQRTLCCIVENYQSEDGKVKIPEVLKSYLDFDEI